MAIVAVSSLAGLGAFAQSPVAASYTAAQATRGSVLFSAKCAVCHGEELTGGPGTPPLKGPEFQFTWKSKSVSELVAFLREKMPPGGADTLTDGQYTDVTALILQANGVEPGATELANDGAAQAGMKLLNP